MNNFKKILDSIDVHSLHGLHLQSLYALAKLSEDTEDRFSATEIANYLINICGIGTSRQAIRYAIEAKKVAIHKDKNGYRLMEPGRVELCSQDNNKIVYIEANKPFSAKNIALKDIFSELDGEILICDPYIDINTLDIIFKNVRKGKRIKILTQNIIDKPVGVFYRHLTDLRSEGYNIEIGQYNNSDLHDRYIMDKNKFWLSGNSLNYLGNKESFIICLGEDIHQSMFATFSNRWKVAQKI